VNLTAGTLRRLSLLLVLAVAACAPARPPAVPTSLDAHVPPFARYPYEPFSRRAAIAIALREWRAFGQPVALPNTELPEDEERAEGLWQRVGEYWWLGLDPHWVEQRWTGIHDENGQVFSAGEDGRFAWSAAFISYVMRMAGAGPRFPYSPSHSDYINAARRHGLGLDPNVALTALRADAYAPQPGDLICAWRGRQPVAYEDLPSGHFPGHCDIVVAIGPGHLDVIGGNVDNAVAMKHIPIAANGRLAGPDGSVLDPDHHWFAVLQIAYDR
jgi:hypothetical protein